MANKSHAQLIPKTNNVIDDYDIKETVLGHGLHGKIRLCIHRATQREYALKALNVANNNDKARREVDLHWRASQECQYIVQIKDVYENYVGTNKVKTLIIIMELMTGGELFAKIVSRKYFTEREVAKMMYQISTAVRHLHKMSIAHRDLKPENLLLSTDDERGIIKLGDFGFAKESNDGLRTPCYTPYYVAPEILKTESKVPGCENYDLTCDIWSLGVIMYILCCGRPPFSTSPNNPKTISSGMKSRIRSGQYSIEGDSWLNVSDEAKDLIKKMLETNPVERISIDDVMNSKWIKDYLNAPSTPLSSLENLKENENSYKEINQNIRSALDEITIDTEKRIKLKTQENINSPLFKKRFKKTNDNTNDQITSSMISFRLDKESSNDS